MNRKLMNMNENLFGDNMSGMEKAKKEDDYDWQKDYFEFESRFLSFYYLHYYGNTRGKDYIDAIMGLHIPISELKVDIATAKEIANKEGFGAEVIINFYNEKEKYLDIYDHLYLNIEIQFAIQKLKNIAREILKEERERAPPEIGTIKRKDVKKFETKVLYIKDSKGRTIREEGISEVSPTILGGMGEFYHTVGKGTASIGLRIPIGEVSDIDSAIAKAKNAGFDATKVIKTEKGYEYLEISKQGYNTADDWNVVVELKKVAIEISKEDYSNHIKDLPLELKTFILVERSVER